MADLINPMTGMWDKDFIDRIFWEVDIRRILNIPLGSNTVDDMIVWHYSKDGRFSVRSCYQHLLHMHTHSGSQGEGSSSWTETWRWEEIWKLPVPPKIRMFLWRACNGILPNKVELFRRRIADSPFCSRCESGVETNVHGLFECRDM